MPLKNLVLAFVFILRLATGSTISLDYIRQHYGQEALKVYYKLLDHTKKIEKTKLDLDFLLKCKVYDIFPKFLRFKLYKKSLQTTAFYKSWQTKLLNNEITTKKKQLKQLQEDSSHDANLAAHPFSFIDRHRIRRLIAHTVTQFTRKTKDTHQKKLRTLGIDNDLAPCDPNKVIHNYSSVPLPIRIKFLLAFGLDFCLPVFKLDFTKYFLNFERLAYTLKQLPSDNFSETCTRIKELAHKYFYSFRASKVFHPIFSTKDINLLRTFGKNKDIVVCKPDKGRGIVIIDKCRYIKSIKELICDPSKFRLITDPIEIITRKTEDRINRFLLKLKNSSLISDDIYKKLFASGSSPGILYGLPKIHKCNFSVKFPFRPIFAAYNTASYNIAKFLVPILSSLTRNKYTADNSYSFAKELANLPHADQYFMASFDVESLFTNIPLHETITICLDLLFRNTNTVLNLTKTLFKQLLTYAVTNTFFIFDGQLYEQVEGLGMGLPLGPTFANIFMCFHETNWLRDCPSSFKPIFYRRYIDDTFLLFKSETHVKPFLDFLNSKHPNIRFTYETETNNTLNFLDTAITRSHNSFLCSVYRKPTFSGLGSSFFSFCSPNFKLTAIKTLLHRAYNICSDYHRLHTEFTFLKSFFHNNGYPSFLTDKYIRNFLNSLYNKKPPSYNVPKKPLYLTLNYFGYQSEKMKSELLSILTKSFPYIDFHLILVNPLKINSFFPFKDRLPKGLSASLVYKFSCAQGSASVSYVGSTRRHLIQRIAEHAGRSPRTGKPLSCPLPSSIRDHANNCSCSVTLDNFSILSTAKSDLDLRLTESIHIHKHRPRLNDKQTALPLLIL